jgi:hypothetical protein
MDFDENKTISYAFKEGLKKCNYENITICPLLTTLTYLTTTKINTGKII